MHHPECRRYDGGAAGTAPAVDVHPVRAVPPEGWTLRRATRRLRGPLFRPDERVRAELQTLGDRPAGADAAGPGANVRTDGRQHLSGGDDVEPVVLDAAGARIRRPQNAHQGTILVWCRGAPR